MFAPDEVYLVTSALQGVVARGTGAPVRSLGYRGPLAAKTGTSDDYRDAWFMGYTPELVVGVRVGYDDDASVGLTARVVALPIFAEFIISALGPEGKSGFVVPGSMEQVDVLDLPGLSPGSAWKGEQELFLAGTAPQGVGRGATADARGRSDASDAQARAVTRAPSDVDAHEARSQAWSPFGWSEDGPAAARRRDNRRRIGGMRPGSHQALAVR